MKIAMVGTRGIPARYGGFETAIEEIGSRIVDNGHDVVVFCRGAEQRLQSYKGMQLVHLPAVKNKFAETLSHTALSVAHRQALTADVAIVFNAANAPMLPMLHMAGVPVAVHVDGLEWQRSKWSGSGRRYYQNAERLAVQWGDELIADARGIQDYYLEAHHAQTRLISYGAPLVDEPALHRLTELGVGPQGYHLIVARSEPENHVHLAMAGYAASSARQPLLVVGSAPYADEYVASLEAIAAGDRRIRMLGGVWDQELLDALYAGASTYVHGHSVGGTNPSLLRAMGAAAPCAAFDVSFNREVLLETGVYWRTADDIARVIEESEALPEEAAARARRGRARVALAYSWDDVAASYEQMCVDLANGFSRRPAGVRRPSPTVTVAPQKRSSPERVVWLPGTTGFLKEPVSHPLVELHDSHAGPRA